MRNPPRTEVQISSFEDRLGEDLYHFMAESGGRNVGFGTDLVPERALIKAISECVERAVMREEGGRTSNGFAAHNSKDKAANRALLECKERDAFLIGWLSGRSPKWLDLQQTGLSDQTSSILAPLNPDWFSYHFGLVAISAGDYVVVGALRPGKSSPFPFGVVLSSACAPSLDEAIRSTALELRRAATVILNRADAKSNFDSRVLDLPKDGRSTFEYYLNPERGQQLDYYFASSQDPLELDFPTPHFSFFAREVADPKLTITVARCEVNDTQSLFFGLPGADNIQHSRFSAVGLKPVNNLVMPLP